MARINIPLDALTTRLNLQGRFDSVRSQSIAQRFAGLKPVTEFLDVRRMSKPKDFSEVGHHLTRLVRKETRLTRDRSKDASTTTWATSAPTMPLLSHVRFHPDPLHLRSQY